MVFVGSVLWVKCKVNVDFINIQSSNCKAVYTWVNQDSHKVMQSVYTQISTEVQMALLNLPSYYVNHFTLLILFQTGYNLQSLKIKLYKLSTCCTCALHRNSVVGCIVLITVAK